MKLPAWVKASAASMSLGAIIGTMAAVMVLGGECSAWKQDHPKPPKPVPTVLLPTEEELATPREIVRCVPVQALKPTEKRAKAIAKETGRPLPPTNPPQAVAVAGPGEIVAPSASGEPDYPLLLIDARPLPLLPDGGKLYVHLEMDGSTSVVVLPNEAKPKPEEKFLQFGNVFEIGGLYGIGQEGDTRSRAWAAYEPLRLGRIHLRAEAGVDIRDGASGSYVLAGAVWRSR